MIGLRITKGDVAHTFALCEEHAEGLEMFASQTCRVERVPAPERRTEIPAWGRTLLDGYACASQLGLPLKEPPSMGPEVPPCYVGVRCAEIVVLEGERIPYATTAVWVHDERDVRELDPRLDLVNHSPTGFEWGYGGSGPAQLALALLADATDDEIALSRHQEFKDRSVALFPSINWVITRKEVKKWASTSSKQA